MNPRPWWKIVDWRIVLAVGVPFWLSVAGGVYLATEKPPTPPVERPSYCPPPAPIETPVDPLLGSCPPYFPPVIEQAPSPRPANEVAVAPRDGKSEASVLAMVKLLSDTIQGFQARPGRRRSQAHTRRGSRRLQAPRYDAALRQVAGRSIQARTEAR